MESGVMYLCPENFREEVPGWMAEAGIACSEHIWSIEESTDFGFKMKRGWGTVTMTGFYEPAYSASCYMLGCGTRIRFWYWDMQLYDAVRKILIDHGAKRSYEFKPT